jgi:hypothetical protein
VKYMDVPSIACSVDGREGDAAIIDLEVGLVF